MTIGLFWTIFAGVIAGILMNGFRPIQKLPGMKGMLALCCIGIVGALAASFAGQVLHLWGREEIGAFISAMVGAGGLLAGVWYGLARQTPGPLVA